MIDDRLYPLQTEEGDFETGHCADGRQVVMGLLCPYLVAFFFDPRGDLVGKEHRLWNRPAEWSNGHYHIYDEGFEAALTQQTRDWQHETGFQPGTIHVKAFFDERDYIGIQPLPDHYLDLETADWVADEQQRQEFIQDRDDWIERGDFVWWWAKDYYMSSDGEVDST